MRTRIFHNSWDISMKMKNTQIYVYAKIFIISYKEHVQAFSNNTQIKYICEDEFNLINTLQSDL